MQEHARGRDIATKSQGDAFDLMIDLTEAARRALIEQWCRSPSRCDRVAACRLIGVTSSERGRLALLLGDRDPWVSAEAFYVAAELDPRAARRAMSSVLEAATHGRARVAAASGVVRLVEPGSRGMLNPLMDLARDSRGAVRSWGLLGLSFCERVPAEAIELARRTLRSRNMEYRMDAIDCLVRHAPALAFRAIRTELTRAEATAPWLLPHVEAVGTAELIEQLAGYWAELRPSERREVGGRPRYTALRRLLLERDGR